MAFGESYSPGQVDEIKNESSKSELVTEGTDGEKTEKIANSTNRGGEKVVDMDTATTENTEINEGDEEGEEDSLELFNGNKDLAKNTAEEIIKENLPDAIKHLDEQGKKQYINNIEEGIAESGVDLPIETVPENWRESLNNYIKVAENRDLLPPDKRKALESAEGSAVKNMEEEAKEKVLSGIINNSMSGEVQSEVHSEEPDEGTPESNPGNTSGEESNPEGGLD